jgi:hypothetical protein
MVRCQIRALILSGLALALPVRASLALPRPNHQPKVWMGMAGTATMPDGTTIGLGGFLFDPDFFDKLEEKKKSDRLIFQRDGKPVEFFPKEMQFKLSVFTVPNLDVKARATGERNLTAEALSALRFLGFWKNGLEMRPVESLSLLTMYAEERKSLLYLLWPDVPETYQVWVFEFRVRTQGVPISDHFILTIETPTKQRLVRLSAHLESRNGIR